MSAGRWVVVAALVAGVQVPAEAAKSKPVRGSYDVSLPVPWSVAGAGTDCAAAPVGLSKDVRSLKISAGTLSVQLSGHVGEWEIALYDAKGKRLGASRVVGPVEASVLALKHKAKQPVTVAVCNYAGGPNGHVEWTFTPR